MDALRQYDLSISRLRLVSNDMNGIFRLDGADGRILILRVCVPQGGHTRDHLTAEMDWLRTLRQDTRLNVPAPVPARDGSLFVSAQAEGVPEPRLVAIFSYVRGSDLADHLSPQNVARLGELSARLHLHAAAYQPPPDLDLLHFDRVFPFAEPVILYEEAFASFIPPVRREFLQQAQGAVQAALDRLKTSGEAMRILHNDLHQWNVRCDHGKLSPIDFEDLMLGWPVQDIATTLYYLPDAQADGALRRAFQQGYTRISPWPERVPGEIEAFLIARGLGMVNFILQDPNPKYADQAVSFITRVEGRLRHWMETGTV